MSAPLYRLAGPCWNSTRRAAPSCRLGVAVALLIACGVGTHAAGAATVTTENFRVAADSESVALRIARRAEELRKSLAEEWLDAELPPWTQPCLIQVDVAAPRLSGQTTYGIRGDRIAGWRMSLAGPLSRILDTLLPHEIVHTVLASHFRSEIPRWADEGAALSAEDEADRRRLHLLHRTRLESGRVGPLAALLAAEEYPTDQEEVRAFYAQGASLTEFLLMGGKSRFLAFLQSGMLEDWDTAVATHYGFRNVSELDAVWRIWLQEDRPRVALASQRALAEGLRLTLASLAVTAPDTLASPGTAAESGPVEPVAIRPEAPQTTVVAESTIAAQ